MVPIESNKNDFSYAMVSTLLIILYSHLFRNPNKDKATLTKDDFENNLFLPVLNKFEKIFEKALILTQLGIPLNESLKMVLLMDTLPDTDPSDIHPEDHNCDACQIKGECPLESTMRNLNKEQVSVDKDIINKLSEIFKSSRN